MRLISRRRMLELCPKETSKKCAILLGASLVLCNETKYFMAALYLSMNRKSLQGVVMAAERVSKFIWGSVFKNFQSGLQESKFQCINLVALYNVSLLIYSFGSRYITRKECGYT